ncbi:MAG: undecaprenyl-diphosphate phosphatase [Ardenticatenia bacterium]|nr:undecaprenyl-diphosphate phosphatase [Ardenticatenia bacterium]
MGKPRPRFRRHCPLGYSSGRLAFFAEDIRRIVVAVVAGLLVRRPLGTPEARLGWFVALGTVPAALAGLTLESLFEELFGRPTWVAFFLIGTGFLLVGSERLHGRDRGLDTLSAQDALLIGVAQALAITPGISRSGATIAAGLVRNLERAAAARFSFLLIVPAVFGAGLLQTVDLWRAGLSRAEWLPRGRRLRGRGRNGLPGHRLPAALPPAGEPPHLRLLVLGLRPLCADRGMVAPMSRWAWTPVLLILFGLVACGAPSRPGAGDELIVVRVTGAEEMVPLLAELAATYADKHPNIFVDVSGGGSQWGLRALFSGLADIGMVSYRPQDEALRSGRQRLNAVEVGRDGLAIIVHPDNPLVRLPKSTLVHLFNGTTFTWDTLGWDAGDVTVFTRERGSGDRTVLETYLFDKSDARMTLNAQLVPTPGALAQAVAETPAGIGYVGLSYLSGAVKALSVEGVPPSPEQVADGSYPLTRSLVLVTQRRPPRAVKDFVEWVLSAEGQAIVARFVVPAQ